MANLDYGDWANVQANLAEQAQQSQQQQQQQAATTTPYEVMAQEALYGPQSVLQPAPTKPSWISSVGQALQSFVAGGTGGAPTFTGTLPQPSAIPQLEQIKAQQAQRLAEIQQASKLQTQKITESLKQAFAPEMQIIQAYRNYEIGDPGHFRSLAGQRVPWRGTLPQTKTLDLLEQARTKKGAATITYTGSGEPVLTYKEFGIPDRTPFGIGETIRDKDYSVYKTAADLALESLREKARETGAKIEGIRETYKPLVERYAETVLDKARDTRARVGDIVEGARETYQVLQPVIETGAAVFDKARADVRKDIMGVVEKGKDVYAKTKVFTDLSNLYFGGVDRPDFVPFEGFITPAPEPVTDLISRQLEQKQILEDKKLTPLESWLKTQASLDTGSATITYTKGGEPVLTYEDKPLFMIPEQKLQKYDELSKVEDSVSRLLEQQQYLEDKKREEEIGTFVNWFKPVVTTAALPFAIGTGQAIKGGKKVTETISGVGEKVFDFISGTPEKKEWVREKTEPFGEWLKDAASAPGGPIWLAEKAWTSNLGFGYATPEQKERIGTSGFFGAGTVVGEWIRPDTPVTWAEQPVVPEQKIKDIGYNELDFFIRSETMKPDTLPYTLTTEFVDEGGRVVDTTSETIDPYDLGIGKKPVDVTFGAAGAAGLGIGPGGQFIEDWRFGGDNYYFLEGKRKESETRFKKILDEQMKLGKEQGTFTVLNKTDTAFQKKMLDKLRTDLPTNYKLINQNNKVYVMYATDSGIVTEAIPGSGGTKKTQQTITQRLADKQEAERRREGGLIATPWKTYKTSELGGPDWLKTVGVTLTADPLKTTGTFLIAAATFGFGTGGLISLVPKTVQKVAGAALAPGYLYDVGTTILTKGPAVALGEELPFFIGAGGRPLGRAVKGTVKGTGKFLKWGLVEKPYTMFQTRKLTKKFEGAMMPWESQEFWPVKFTKDISIVVKGQEVTGITGIKKIIMRGPEFTSAELSKVSLGPLKSVKVTDKPPKGVLAVFGERAIEATPKLGETGFDSKFLSTIFAERLKGKQKFAERLPEKLWEQYLRGPKKESRVGAVGGDIWSTMITRDVTGVLAQTTRVGKVRKPLKNPWDIITTVKGKPVYLLPEIGKPKVSRRQKKRLKRLEQQQRRLAGEEKTMLGGEWFDVGKVATMDIGVVKQMKVGKVGKISEVIVKTKTKPGDLFKLTELRKAGAPIVFHTLKRKVGVSEGLVPGIKPAKQVFGKVGRREFIREKRVKRTFIFKGVLGETEKFVGTEKAFLKKVRQREKGVTIPALGALGKAEQREWGWVSKGAFEPLQPISNVWAGQRVPRPKQEPKPRWVKSMDTWTDEGKLVKGKLVKTKPMTDREYARLIRQRQKPPTMRRAPFTSPMFLKPPATPKWQELTKVTGEEWMWFMGKGKKLKGVKEPGIYYKGKHYTQKQYLKEIRKEQGSGLWWRRELGEPRPPTWDELRVFGVSKGFYKTVKKKPLIELGKLDVDKFGVKIERRDLDWLRAKKKPVPSKKTTEIPKGYTKVETGPYGSVQVQLVKTETKTETKPLELVPKVKTKKEQKLKKKKKEASIPAWHTYMGAQQYQQKGKQKYQQFVVAEEYRPQTKAEQTFMQVGPGFKQKEVLMGAYRQKREQMFMAAGQQKQKQKQKQKMKMDFLWPLASTQFYTQKTRMKMKTEQAFKMGYKTRQDFKMGFLAPLGFKMGSKYLQESLLDFDQAQEGVLGYKQAQRYAQKSKYGLEFAQAQVQDFAQAQRNVTQQVQRQRLKQSYTQRQRPPQRLKTPRRTKIPFRTKLGDDEGVQKTRAMFKLEEKATPLYQPMVRKRGKWVLLGKALPKGLALRMGAAEVKKTLAATFRIVPTGKKTEKADLPFVVSEKVFRRPKIGALGAQPLTFIQRGGREVSFVKGARLASLGERRQIRLLRTTKTTNFGL